MSNKQASSTPDRHDLWSAGYRSLVPITAPGGKPSPEGAYHRRPHDMGKGPGVKNRDGLWVGVPWLREDFTATPEKLDAWERMGCGYGLKVGVADERGWRLVAIDIDLLAPALSERAVALARLHLGDAPIRTGQAPKRLMLYRTKEALENAKVEVDDGVTAAPKVAMVDVLAHSKQFVAFGTHPVTGRPYTWERFDIADGLRDITSVKVGSFLAAIAAEFPEAKLQAESASDRANVDQAALRGPLAAVRDAVAALPNGPGHRSYEAYRNVGIAIKASLPEDPDEAEALWLDWCSRWTEGTNTVEQAQRHFRSFKPPFGLGATYLYAQAAEHGEPEAFSLAGAMFEELPEPSPAEARAEAARVEAAVAARKVKWIDPAKDWEGREPKVREWLWHGIVPRREITMLYGDGGVGKTLVAHVIGTALALGLGGVFGLKAAGPCRVMLFLCEDDEDELQRRQRDILKAFGKTEADLGGRLLIASRKYLDNTLAGFDRATGLIRATELWKSLRSDVAGFDPDLTVVDTAADTYGGSEIDRQQVRQFIQTAMGGLIKATKNGAVMLLAHPSRSGMSSGSGDSGSTGWSNSVRSRLYLQPVEGDGALRILTIMKSNYATKGDSLTLRWRAGSFELVNASISDQDAKLDPDSFPDSTAANEAAVYEALVKAQAEQAPIAPQPTSPNSVGKALKRLPASPVVGLQVREIEKAFAGLLARGIVAWGVVGKTAQRKAIHGVEVKGDLVLASAPAVAAGFEDLEAAEADGFLG